MARAGRYELLEKIGVGGMAEIYRARAFTPGSAKGTIVCVKKILPHLSEDPEYRQMFMDEARVAFTLRHPNVVQMMDLGRIDDQLFLALEFVDGADLHEVLMRARDREAPLPVAASLHIAIEVLKGLHYAHSRRAPDGKPMAIVHRDVSPGNVLVSREGNVKLGDFGIARAAVRAGRTIAGVVKGNALYMAPEQITGGTMDARTDVYGAGLLLLTLLCGRHPWEREPLPRLIDFGVAADVPDPSALDPAVPKELDVIVGRATELDPGVRYQTAMEFGMAIEAFARGKGLALGPDALRGALVALLPPPLPEPGPEQKPITYVGPIDPVDEDDPTGPLSGDAPISSFRTYVGPMDPITDGPTRVNPAAADATRVSATAADATRLSPSPPPLPATRDAVPPILDAVTRTQIPQLQPAPARPSRLRLAAHPKPVPVTADSGLPRAILVVDASIVAGVHRQSIASVAWSRDDEVVSAGIDQTVRVWDLTTTRELRSFRAHPAAIISLSLSLDGGTAVTGSRDRTLRVWDLASGTLRRTLSGHDGWVFACAISADNLRIVSGGQDRTLRVWDEGAASGVLEGHTDTVAGIALLDGATRALSASYDRTVRLWDLERRECMRVLEAENSVRAVAAFADGARAVSGGADSHVTLWDLSTGAAITRLAGHREPVVAVAVSTDGRRILSGSYDATIRLWDVESGACLASFLGHTDPVTSVAFSPDRQRFVSGGTDGTVRVWRFPL